MLTIHAWSSVPGLVDECFCGLILLLLFLSAHVGLEMRVVRYIPFGERDL